MPEVRLFPPRHTTRPYNKDKVTANERAIHVLFLLPRASATPSPQMRAVPLALLLWPVMSSAFSVPLGTFVLRANTRSQRSIATCVSPPFPGIVLASSAAIGHMSLSGSEIAEESSILVLLAMAFIFVGGLFTDKQRLKPLAHLKMESQTAGGRLVLVPVRPLRGTPLLSCMIHCIPPQAVRPPLASHRRTGAKSASWSQRQHQS